MPRQNKIILRNGTTVPNGADFDIGEPAWNKDAGTLYVKNSAGTMVSIGAPFTGGTLTSGLIVASGTTSLAPLSFQSGTNLTTAASGAMEYDGTAFYSTPAGRGISPSIMYYRLNSGLAGSNATGAQSIFGVGVTLSANTIYAFDGFYILQKTAGTTSHTIGVSFGGTATLNNLNAGIIWNRENSAATSSNMTALASSNHSFLTSSANLVLTSSISSASQTLVARTHGSVSINASGTFIPRYTLSAAPGGAYSTLAGSYFAIWPIGAAGANVSVGPWA
jgi:hypothetical protein